jgi:predicted transcriptional regulator
MTTNIIFCNKNTSSKELMKIISENKIIYIPIIEQKKLLGTVQLVT